MITEINFILNEEKKIVVKIPDIKSKFNYYYEPSEKLHKFDEVTVFFVTKDCEIEIFKDSLDDFIVPFYRLLKKAIANNLELPREIEEGKAGEMLNDYLNERSTLDLKPFWLCSSLKNNDTLLYTKNNKIYMEVTPLYPWTFIEPKSEDNYISFDEFMKSYKPDAVEPILHVIACEWLAQCLEIINLTGLDE